MGLRRIAGYLAVIGLVVATRPMNAGSSNGLLDVSPDSTRLLVANPDNGSVTVVDVRSSQVVREIAVGEKPESVTWIDNGPLAAAAVYREDMIVFFDTTTGQVTGRLKVASEPYGMVANRAGTRAWVTHEYPGEVSEIDLSSRKIARRLRVGEFLRGIALAPDEKRLYVTEFYTGTLHAVDLTADSTWAVADSWKGQPTDNLCRHVVVHPKRPKAYLAHIRSKVKMAHGAGSIFPHVSICDLIPPAAGGKRRTSFAMDTYNGVYVTTNAWEAEISPDGRRFYSIYAGTNDMNLSQVVDDDYQEIEPIGSPVQLGQNPRAIRASPDGKHVYVYNTLDFSVSMHDARTMRKLGQIRVCQPPKSAEWVRGKILFNTALPPLTSRRWIACASCHPDGHHDQRVWQNPEGLRKTTALFGMAHTHPLHWSADRDEAQDFEYTIRGPLMQGRGLYRGPIIRKSGFEKTELEQPFGGKSPDLDALAIYCNSFEVRLSPHAEGPGKLSPAAERGRKLFFDRTTNCSSCHSGPYYSDSSLKQPYKLHDVGTGGHDPSEKMGTAYDTPTLLGTYRTAPYLHDGRAATLRDVLTTCNPADKHGRTSHLKPAEVEDLVAFLKSLPYEKPPAETPNTVKFRFQSEKSRPESLGKS